MISGLQKILLLRSKIENSNMWGFATRSILHIIVSMLAVFGVAIVALTSSPFLFFYSPLLGIFAFAVFLVLMYGLHILADELRRREKRWLAARKRPLE
ncbi:hypothetical protein [Ruegeria hyattellae]|uniref:hypothetical protein n=1 Tax=Ruegeria hyattellae TaxID=3233337 RepID=UPI00355B62EE